MELQEQIKKAQAARAELDHQREIERQAAELPSLQKQQVAQVELAASADALRANVARAGNALGELHGRVTAWRERFAALAEEAQALADEYGDITMTIYTAGRGLRRAAHHHDQTRRRFDRGRGDSFQGAWEQAGGSDPALALEPISPGEWKNLPGELFEVLRRGLPTYRPKYGAGNLRDIPGVRSRF